MNAVNRIIRKTARLQNIPMDLIDNYIENNFENDVAKINYSIEVFENYKAAIQNRSDNTTFFVGQKVHGYTVAKRSAFNVWLEAPGCTPVRLKIQNTVGSNGEFVIKNTTTITA